MADDDATELPVVLGSDLAPVLGARRDGSARVDTSRPLLMTVLGELVLPNGGEAWTQTLIAVLELLGIRDKAARQALARMRDRGWLVSERVGRRTRWRLTGHATGLLEAGAERIYGFGRGERSWDGRWLVLMARVPERDRHLRHRLGVGLSWAGFGSLGQGLWLSPWADRERAAVEVTEQLGVTATSFRAELGRLGSGADLVDQAWDLAELRALYDRFLAETTAPPGRGDEAVGDLVSMVHRWRRFPLVDPDLPAELLPADWPSIAAADRFADRRRQLVPRATEWWRTAEGDAEPAG